MLACSGYLWAVGQTIRFGGPDPMGPLGSNSGRGRVIKHNRDLLKRQQKVARDG
jgi:hypothetical protein